jgi:hypothetical protein
MGVYAAFIVFCAVFGYALVGSIARDVFGQRMADGAPRASNDMACVDDVNRLFALLAARAIQPAPRGVDESAALEWDRWSRRWEDDLAEVSSRCRLDAPSGPARRHLAEALDGLENLRREVDRSGTEAGNELRRVRDALTAARAALEKP